MFNNKLIHGDKISGDFELYLKKGDQWIKNEQYSRHQRLEIGKNSYLPQFDDKLINRGFKKELEVVFTFSNNYKIQEFQGLQAKVLLKNLKLKKQAQENYTELLEKIKALQGEVDAKETQLKLMEYTFKVKAEELNTKAKEQIANIKAETETKAKEQIQEQKVLALAKFIEDFEMPFNNFVMAAKAGEVSENEIVRNYCLGFSLVIKQFEQVLQDHGVILIEPKIGAEFDPHNEQVVDFVNNEELQNNIITKVVRSGFKLGTRVIKPASVVVNKK